MTKLAGQSFCSACHRITVEAIDTDDAIDQVLDLFDKHGTDAFDEHDYGDDGFNAELAGEVAS